MEDYRKIINEAKPGQIVPIVKEIDIDEPVDFFAKLSDYGRAENAAYSKQLTICRKMR